jgi:hypothetical protein
VSPHQGKFIAYFRVSTEGKSGLGLEAQRKAVLDYLNGGRWELAQEFVEVESGKHNERPQLEAALAACKKHRARLVIAKLDRLSRNLAFIATLIESGVEFTAVDNPHANTISLLAGYSPSVLRTGHKKAARLEMELGRASVCRRRSSSAVATSRGDRRSQDQAGQASTTPWAGRCPRPTSATKRGAPTPTLICVAAVT